MELLAKAIGPDDIGKIAAVSSTEGPSLIDHKAQAQALSTGHMSKHMEKYQKVLAHPKTKRVDFHDFAEGITPKQVFEHGGSKYIVKPFFEQPDSAVTSFAKFPICGWLS